MYVLELVALSQNRTELPKFCVINPSLLLISVRNIVLILLFLSLTMIGNKAFIYRFTCVGCIYKSNGIGKSGVEKNKISRAQRLTRLQSVCVHCLIIKIFNFNFNFNFNLNF